MISEPIRLRVWGPYACFTRPEFHVERVSYPVITPSAARGILEAILMKPIEKPETSKRGDKEGFRWHILRIGVVRKGTMVPILRNELGYERFSYGGYDILEERTQRHSLILRHVEYLLDGVLEVPEGRNFSNDTGHVAKYQHMFERRARNGQCYHRPYLGCREFPCDFEWAPDAQPVDANGNRLNESFGMILRDLDFDPVWQFWPSGKERPGSWKKENGFSVTPLPVAFHAMAKDGWINVAKVSKDGARKEVVFL
jgi:CRISPR-associated protein Cas5d